MSVETTQRPYEGSKRRACRTRIIAVLGTTILGLGIQVVGYSLGRDGNSSGAVALFFVGLGVVVVPCAWRLLDANVTRTERLQICVVLGLALLLSYYLRDPLRFDRFDELLHVATLRQMVTQRQLFTENSALPVSPYYPGLELVTAVVHWGSGLPLVASQLAILVVARVLLVLGLFLILERVTGSARIAGIGILVYSASQQFYFFNSQFAYQSLALALAVSAVYLVLTAVDRDKPELGRRGGLAIACLAALTITHHIVSWITVALFVVWAIALAKTHRREAARVVGLIAAAGVAFVGGWMAFVGARLGFYLVPIFRSAYDQLSAYVNGTHGGRTLFQDAAGTATPGWERALIVLSALGWIALIAVSGWAVVKSRVLRDNPLRLVLLAVALTYPLLLVVRVSSQSAQIADRASTFVFFAIAIVVGSWLAVARWRVDRRLALGAVLVIFLGGLILGSGPDWARVPGPYLVTADQRSVDSTAITATSWARDHLPEGSRIAADRVNGALLGATGHVLPVTGHDGHNVAPLFFSRHFGSYELRLIRRARIQYFLVDQRLTTGLPHVGFYFESDSNSNGQRLTESELAKFGRIPGLRRIYHYKSIAIYDASGVVHRPRPALLAKAPSSGGLDGTDGWVLALALVVAAAWVRRAARRRPISADAIVDWLIQAVCLTMLVGVIVVPISVSTRPIAIAVLIGFLILGLLPARRSRALAEPSG